RPAGSAGQDGDRHRDHDDRRDDRHGHQDPPGDRVAEVQRDAAALLGDEDALVARIPVEVHSSVGRWRSTTGRTSATVTGAPRAAPSSAVSEVTPASRMPQGTKRSKLLRSQSQLMAKPCWVTPRET